MVLVYLARHWFASRHFSIMSLAACIVCSVRVLLFWRAHRRLAGMAFHREYVARGHDDVFHHVSHRDYLIKGLSLAQRVRCALTHYRFEDRTFDSTYKQAVYRDGGLLLWECEADGRHFAIRLAVASRQCAEGDLSVVATVDGMCMHLLSFSWVEGSFAGVPVPIVPFVARNQGQSDPEKTLAPFERVFPHNSPSFFCAAALNGIAQGLGINRLVAVQSDRQRAYTADAAARFANAYDGFWRNLSTVGTARQGWDVALPFRLRPLSMISAKHRKRAATRRQHWGDIAESSRLAMVRHLAPVCAQSRVVAIADGEPSLPAGAMLSWRMPKA